MTKQYDNTHYAQNRWWIKKLQKAFLEKNLDSKFLELSYTEFNELSIDCLGCLMDEGIDTTGFSEFIISIKEQFPK